MENQIIKAIETEYNGYRFRSRLEARWAVFFDAAGIRYVYEPEGFQLEDGTMYLPDFYLPILGIYVEVKNENAFGVLLENNCASVKDGTEKGEKYLKFAYFVTQKLRKMFLFVFGDPFKAFFDSRESLYLFFDGVCRLHELSKFLPDDEQISCEDGTSCKECQKFNIGFSCVQNSVILADDTAIAITDSLITVNSDNQSSIFFITPKELESKELKISDCFEENFHIVAKSCNIARQARFEHGETPTAAEVYRIAHSGGVSNADRS